MKKISLFTFLALAFSSGLVFGQFTGKRFISGEISAGLNTYNPDELKSTNQYGFGINANLGRFRTETRASGWSLTGTVSGGKRYQALGRSTTVVNGLGSLGFGVGHFWQFYKHFNEHFGIFAGPDIGLQYAYGKNVSVAQEALINTKSHELSFALGISSGAYYKLTERWWLLGSLAFSQPVLLKYTLENTANMQGEDERTHHNLAYGFTPGITFPSVGLGIRYFFRD